MADDTTPAPAPGTVDTLEAPEAEARPQQSVTVEDIGPALKRLTIEVPESRIKKKIEDTYGNLRDDAVLPGFRRGRAPRRLLEKRFADSIKGDVKGQLLSESYTQAIEDEKLDVLGEPDVKDVDKIEVPESGPLSYVVEVEVTPEVKLPDFKAIKVEKKVAPLGDEDIAKEIESYRERYGKMQAITDATVAEGDYVQSDTHVYGGENVDTSKGHDDENIVAHHHGAYTLVNGAEKEFKGHVAGILVRDMGKQLAGKKVGESVVISMQGPDAHENDKIKGRPITIKMDITHVHRLEPAAMEDLIPQFGLQSEDELKERVKTMLEQRNEQATQADMHRQVTKHLVDGVDLALPEGLKGRQIERVLQRQRMELLYSGKSPEEVEAALAEVREKGEADATRQLKTFFVLDKAAKDLEIEVQENEINGRIAMMAYQQQRRPEKLRSEMRQRGELEQLFLSIREQKTLDKVIEQATVTEVEGTPGGSDDADSDDA